MEESPHSKALGWWADSFIGNTNTNINGFVIVEADCYAPLGPKDHNGLETVTNLMALWSVPYQDIKT